jgi:preprotein translocase subunit SecD
MQNLRWKIITILVVFVVFAAVGIYPIVAAQYGITWPNWLVDKQLKLGLDLKGGVHLVLRVQTDDALRIETGSEARMPRSGKWRSRPTRTSTGRRRSAAPTPSP